MQLINIPAILLYISDVPFFWASMGLITAIGIFIGSLVYNGDLKNLTKGLLTVTIYSGLLCTMNINRVFNVFLKQGITNSGMAFAGSATAVVILLFYILGMFIGVTITQKVHGNKTKPTAQQ